VSFPLTTPERIEYPLNMQEERENGAGRSFPVKMQIRAE
jgi:hypothetical protein